MKLEKNSPVGYIIHLLLQFWQAKAILIVIVVLFALRKDISIQVSLNDVVQESTSISESTHEVAQFSIAEPAIQAVNVSQKIATKAFTEIDASKQPTEDNLANTYSNLTYKNNSFSTSDAKSALAAKRRKQAAYVKRFAKAAQAEMEKYGIPASITLAQGLIESNCGESKLATKNNNHFGIKCFSKSCKKGHCSNYTDDSHKDFFRNYKSAWESYRSHSLLLQKSRYKGLYKLPISDYKGWARGLKKAGYATDPHYADKLIELIEALELYRLDR